MRLRSDTSAEDARATRLGGAELRGGRLRGSLPLFRGFPVRGATPNADALNPPAGANELSPPVPLLRRDTALLREAKLLSPTEREWGPEEEAGSAPADSTVPLRLARLRPDGPPPLSPFALVSLCVTSLPDGPLRRLRCAVGTAVRCSSLWIPSIPCTEHSKTGCHSPCLL